MEVVSFLNPGGKTPLVLTCEHASCAVPVQYDDLGLDGDELREHIAWDIGARQLTEVLSRRLDAPAVLGGVSRLVIDCNRDLADHDLIVGESHGVRIPGNQRIDVSERERRIAEFYQPYHDAVDAVLGERPQALLFSVHSFTPELNGRTRRFDVGVLFDVFAADAQELGAELARDGLTVRYNEPYSGLDGLIFSARTHGMRHGLRYLELEVNNGILREPPRVDAIAQSVARALATLVSR